jgi:hypothetical protein
LTWQEATSHSLPQLKLMAQAAARVQANDGLLQAQITASAVAASMSKGGGSMLMKLQKQLKKAAEY